MLLRSDTQHNYDDTMISLQEENESLDFDRWTTKNKWEKD